MHFLKSNLMSCVDQNLSKRRSKLAVDGADTNLSGRLFLGDYSVAEDIFPDAQLVFSLVEFLAVAPYSFRICDIFSV